MFELRFLFTGLFVSAQGRLSRGWYIWGIVRLWLAYSIGSNFLSGAILGIYPSLRTAEDFSVQPVLAIARLIALCVIAWPLWSQVRRRVNDVRPDIQERIRHSAFISALLPAAFVAGLVLRGFAVELPYGTLATEMFGGLFGATLFALSFAPGTNLSANPTRSQPLNTTEPTGLRGARPNISATSKAQNAPPLVQRLNRLPKDGRVKPGWFS